MTTRRLRREDPAYLQAMKEAKAMFEAEMAKSAMKGRGRPKTVVVAAAAAPVADEDALDLVDEHPEESAEDAEEAHEEIGGHDADEAEEEPPAAKVPARKGAKPAPAGRSTTAGKAAKATNAKTAKVTKVTKAAKPAKGAKGAKPAAKDTKAKKPAARRR